MVGGELCSGRHSHGPSLPRLITTKLEASGAGAITDTLVGSYAMYAITSDAGNLNATGNTNPKHLG